MISDLISVSLFMMALFISALVAEKAVKKEKEKFRLLLRFLLA